MAIITKSLSKNYISGNKKIYAVNEVDLEIATGSITAIVGPSGAGKSTLMHLIGGLDRPSSGKVFINRTDIYDTSDRERSAIRNGKIGFVFQFYHLLPEFNALENVMLPALMRRPASRQNRKEISESARSLLKNVGLSHRLSHRPGELSGGESQRVAIARALINGPEILLCDEPTGNLDLKTRDAIYDILLEVKESSGMTLVIVTHDEKISSRVKNIINMRDGQIDII